MFFLYAATVTNARAITRLGLYRLRNLADQECSPEPGINLITGENASGKTSFLEAIHILARASSFRTARVEQAVRYEADDLITTGLVVDGHGVEHHLGVQRGRSGTRVRIDQQTVSNLSELARYLPVQVINTESQRLLNDGPKVRRSFLNWTVFHVEQDYYQHWRRYDRALKQRNAALRLQQRRLSVSWESELVAAAHAVDEARQRVIRSLLGELEPLIDRWLPDTDIGITYRRGWPEDKPLTEALEANRQREAELRYTLAGPHRADLQIRAGGVEAQHWLSRGQQKTLAIALLLAQSRLIAGTGAVPVLLIDDLRAELDCQHARHVLEEVIASPAQCFITAIERDGIPIDVNRWFQIRGGRLQEMI